MEPLTTGIVFTIVMLVFLLLSEMPVAFATGLAGAIGIYVMIGSERLPNSIISALYPVISSNVYITLPMFVLMGFFVAESGIGADIFTAVKKWLGWIRGGLAMATSVACALLGALIAGAMVEALLSVSVALPEMRRCGYKDILSTGTIAGASNLAALIPPSVPLIIYGIMAQTSIGDLFIASIGAGILTMILFMVAIYIWCRIDPSAGPASTRVPLREMIRLPSGLYIAVVIAIVCLGGIYAGFATPTEAGAIGAFIALVFGVATRRLGWGGFTKAFRSMIRTTGMVFMLLIGAMIFANMLALSGIPFKLVDALTGMAVQPWVILAVIMLLYIILGFFLPILPILLILIPVTTPVFASLGFDLVWIGVLTVITMLIGTVTPPVGVLVFVIAGAVPDVPMWTIFKGVAPFFGMMIVALVLIIVFPDIALGLVKLMRPWAYG